MTVPENMEMTDENEDKEVRQDHQCWWAIQDQSSYIEQCGREMRLWEGTMRVLYEMQPF